MDSDVVVIGAGLAGLQCARRLQRNGLTAIVCEARDQVGGRVRTDRVDGYLCDRGFQVLNPAYPAVKEWIDVDGLELRRFGTGITVRTPAGLRTVASPVRHPRHTLATLRSGLLDGGDIAALVRWMGPTLLRATVSSRATRDATLTASLDAAGATGRLRRDVLDTFLAGVLADSSGGNSANYVRLLLRSFALAVPGVPAAGMQALPEQMAASLPGRVRTSTPVRGIRETGTGVEVDTDAGVVRAHAVAVAVGPKDVEALTGEPTPLTHGLTTWWFRAPQAPTASPFLHLDASAPGGGPNGPVWNTAVMSNTAPSYAPRGGHLIQATTLLDRADGQADERTVRAHLERIYGTSTRGWEVLVHHVVRHTLPAVPPPLVDRSPQRISDRVFVCGDHRDTASIQGALVSGDRAGRGIAGVLTETAGR